MVIRAIIVPILQNLAENAQGTFMYRIRAFTGLQLPWLLDAMRR